MNIKPLLAALAFAGAAIASAPAQATTISLAPGGPGSFAGSLVVAADGLIIDDFDFSPASFNGFISVTLSSLGGPVTFFTGVLFPDTASELDFADLSGVPGSDFSFSANVTSALPLTLRVFGAVTDVDGNLGGPGSYKVAVTAVPEPQTYALLLAGFGALGFASRRRWLS